MIPLANLRTIKRLKIDRCTNVTIEIFKHFTSLRTVRFYAIENLDKGMYDLIRFNDELQGINLCWCEVNKIKNVIDHARKPMKKRRNGMSLDISGRKHNVRIIPKRVNQSVKLHFEFYENIRVCDGIEDFSPIISSDDEVGFMPHVESYLTSGSGFEICNF